MAEAPTDDVEADTCLPANGSASGTMSAPDTTVNQNAGQERKFRSTIYSETVQVFVANSDPFIVHKSIITKIPWFEKCLSAPMSEGLSGVIRLPEDDPTAFEDMLGFLYFGKSALEMYDAELLIAENDNHETIRKPLWDAVFKLYVLAEKIQFEHLHNCLADNFVRYARCRTVSIRQLEAIESELTKSCAMVRFWLHDLAYTIRGEGLDHFDYEETLLDWTERGGSLPRELFRLMGQFDLECPLGSSKCTWHIHSNGATCDGDSANGPNEED